MTDPGSTAPGGPDEPVADARGSDHRASDDPDALGGVVDDASGRQVEPWYAVRCVVRLDGDDGPGATYEERITLWRAPSPDEAIELAEAEVVAYAAELGDAEYTGFAQSYNLFVGDQVGHGDEVFSLMRDSDLDTEDYLDHFFDTGAEHQGALDDD